MSFSLYKEMNNRIMIFSFETKIAGDKISFLSGHLINFTFIFFIYFKKESKVKNHQELIQSEPKSCHRKGLKLQFGI